MYTKFTPTPNITRLAPTPFRYGLIRGNPQRPLIPHTFRCRKSGRNNKAPTHARSAPSEIHTHGKFHYYIWVNRRPTPRRQKPWNVLKGVSTRRVRRLNISGRFEIQIGRSTADKMCIPPKHNGVGGNWKVIQLNKTRKQSIELANFWRLEGATPGVG